MNKNISVLFCTAALMVACNKKIDEIRPLVKIDQEGELSSAAGIVEATVGNYSLLRGSATTSYDEPLANISESRGNNVTLRTFGPVLKITDAFAYQNSPGPQLGFSSDFYRGAYQIIVSVNTTLEGIATFKQTAFSSSTEADKNKVLYAEGENHFLRAFTYFNLIRLYGKPYYQDAANSPGVGLKLTSSLTDMPAPASVKAVYDFIISELQLAAQQMKTPVTKPNSFATTGAAWALLSRVYLYMGGSIAQPNAGFNDAVITYVDSTLNYSDGKYTLIQGADYQHLFADDETGALGRAMFANNKEIIFAFDNATGSTRLGLLYNYDPQYNGGGTFLPGQELLQLLQPADIRKTFLRTNPANGRLETTKMLVLFAQLLTHAPNIYLRVGEQYLNRAEAHAKLGNFSAARADLKLIHTRAGLPAADVDALTDQELLEAILKERRLELAFEGHAGYDYFRNGLPMIRQAADNSGQQLVIPPDDPKVVFTIPTN
ncbi:RagB/SusD family nutrient uptake outer membrane protein [Chitinophaga sp. sic0106]|uniref:RagB/SusD family nutrient uptake outer membrane protein n=1 Tax=Chitinophaga sp. sic0106 TaxID=2854785 RepID=UPI001C45DBA1|nr:RagB/SusD family nutrient uptake outer membrane protein [Chitinophaga sp. sic0106]MBV7529663.1 RagB/SusD family nutrient uptake outer membrane protein [Chitinophaga sp. sic0106]